ncbi:MULTISPECIES: hypothetical protein [unclassified Bradyrhizobium]|uniref:hypothetical protein n=1 Tax=unclassified Bradyrhizobium TaxID=2631580 RepID=UPI00339106D8
MASHKFAVISPFQGWVCNRAGACHLALDRLLSDKGLRSRMPSELAKNDVKDELTTEAQTALENIDTAVQSESLPARNPELT